MVITAKGPVRGQRQIERPSGEAGAHESNGRPGVSAWARKRIPVTYLCFGTGSGGNSARPTETAKGPNEGPDEG